MRNLFLEFFSASPIKMFSFHFSPLTRPEIIITVASSVLNVFCLLLFLPSSISSECHKVVLIKISSVDVKIHWTFTIEILSTEEYHVRAVDGLSRLLERENISFVLGSRHSSMSKQRDIEAWKQKANTITRIHIFVGGKREKYFVPLRRWNHFSMAYLITFIIYFNRIVSHMDRVLNN